jgi:Pentapeptide repeats (9 copies)
MLRPLALVLSALALVLAVPAPPAGAEDDLVRQLVNACLGCRFPHDLRGRDLHGLHFVGADLRDVDLSRANLNGAVFTGADLENARFDDADLRNTRFTGVRFANTSFARAKLDNITMEGVRLGPGAIVGADYATFLRRCTGCDLTGTAGAPRSYHSYADVERRLRDLALHPPTIPPQALRRLHELELHPPAIPPLPPLPPDWFDSPLPAPPAPPARR